MFNYNAHIRYMIYQIPMRRCPYQRHQHIVLSILILNSQCVDFAVEGIDIWYMVDHYWWLSKCCSLIWFNPRRNVTQRSNALMWLNPKPNLVL